MTSSTSTAINHVSMVNSQSLSFRSPQCAVTPCILCELCRLLAPCDKLKFLSILGAAQILPVFHLDFHAINLKPHTSNYLTILLLYHVTLTFF